MNTGQRTVVSLLAAIAVLLGVNIIVKTSPAAVGQEGQGGNGEPYIVKVLPLSAGLYQRVWSDGRYDILSDSTDCEYILVWSQGPVEHPFPVVDAEPGYASQYVSAMLTYGDGRVDLVQYDHPRCTIAGVGTPSLCTADVDRDGVIGTADLLEVLNQWGPCEP